MTKLSSRYAIPSGPHRVQEVIQKSRFITLGGHAPTPEAARAFVEEMREQFPDATHHCWAFVAGPPGDSASIGMSDDGEPHGTAGRPMLNVLLHGGVGEIVAVSVRYYGGTKLGTGGLTRAYSGGVKLLLESLPTEEKVDRVTLQIIVAYSATDSLGRLLAESEGTIEVQEFGERVVTRVSVPRDRVESLSQAVAGLTRGQGAVSKV